MNRIDEMFAGLKKRNEAALMCYLPSTGPDFSRSLEVIDAYVQGGVDLIELSVPGGAPWLDGTPMQEHHKQSRETGVDTKRAFELARQVRKRYPQLPILPMAYHAAAVGLGVERFVDYCVDAQVDGVEIPDYPSYGAHDPHGLHAQLRKAGVYNINFCNGISVAPEGTAPHRLFESIAGDVDGFLFLTATPGVTGAQGSVAVAHLTQAVRNIRSVMAAAGRPRPILVGFGLSTTEHVSQVVQDIQADALVVGSAVSRLINRGETAREIMSFVASLKEATRNRPGERSL